MIKKTFTFVLVAVLLGGTIIGALGTTMQSKPNIISNEFDGINDIGTATDNISLSLTPTVQENNTSLISKKSATGIDYTVKVKEVAGAEDRMP